MQKSTAARTSRELEQTKTRARAGSYNSESLENTTWKLLLTHQAHNNPQQATANKSRLEEKRIALSNEALRADTSSAVTAAFCLALLDDGIEKPFEKLLETSKHCPDHQMFCNARKALLHTTIFFPFVIAPHQLDKTQILALYDYSISEECTNNISRMLIGARFESGMELERAVIIYASLLAKNFSPNSQLANLMRIGEGSPEALYQIGKHILKTKFSVEKFQAPIIDFFKTAYSRLKADDSPAEIQESFEEFFDAEDIRWDDIAIMCITLAVYNNKHSLEPASRYLSTLYTLGEVVPKSSQKACTSLEYSYRRSRLRREKEKNIDMLKKFHAENSEDLWVNSMLASVYTAYLKSLKKESEEATIFEFTRKAYDHYVKVYDRLFSEYQKFYRESFPLMPELARNSYELASILLKLHDQYRSNIKLGPLLLEQAVTLLKKSGKLAHSKSHYKIARLEEVSLSSPSPKEALDLVNAHYRFALEGAMATLNLKEYQTILKSYSAFVRKHNPTQQLIVIQYQVREKDLDSNLQVLTLYRNNKYGTTEFKNLAQNSPMGCALDWENSIFFDSSYYNRHVDLLITRGLVNSLNAKFNDDIITLLTDYFILASTYPQARVFFSCLKKGLANTNKIDASLAQEIAVVIDFYLNILDGDFLDCRIPFERYPEACKKVFNTLEQRFLLQPATYDFLQCIMNPKSTAPFTFRKGSGPGFFDDSREAELFAQFKSLPDSARRNILQSAASSPRDELFSSGEKGAVSPQPRKILSTSIKLLGDSTSASADSTSASPQVSPSCRAKESAPEPSGEPKPESQLVNPELPSKVIEPTLLSQTQQPTQASQGEEPLPPAALQKKELPTARIITTKKPRLSGGGHQPPRRAESAPADFQDLEEFSPPLRGLSPVHDEGDTNSDEQDEYKDTLSP